MDTQTNRQKIASYITRQFRRQSGMAKFERTCRLTKMGGRLTKAWKVPGTQEHGRWSSMNRLLYDNVASALKDIH